MASASGDRFEVSIGGNASGPVVVGDGNRVEVHHAAPEPRPEPRPDGTDGTDETDAVAGAAASTQTNTAHDNGTIYTVMHGDLHIHQAAPDPPTDEAP